MQMSKPESPLNEARFRAPARSQRFIRRARVTLLLDEAVTHPLTAVIGPAGTGKTLAVADWTREGRLPGPALWVSLDRGDSDPALFWASVLTSLRLECGEDAFRGLEIPDAPDTGFLSGAAANVGGTLVLILDDVHEIERGTVTEWIDRLLRWPPADVHLVLISRHDPPLALARLRLEEKLAEVRFADLAFTRDETAELLSEWGVHLSEAALGRLTESTGGWVAAIRLAALTLKTASDPSDVIERFGGPTFLVSEYLWDEVLHLLPARYSEFLLRTSIAPRICAPLAAALTDEQDADLLLRHLAQEELLVQELEDTGWYRTHSLMAEVLRARLKTDRPELEQELHRRAALWFEGRQAWIEALRHAVASRDWEFAGRVALRSGAVAMFGPDRAGFVEVMACVPGEMVHDHPELLVAFAVAAYCRVADDDFRSLMQHAAPAVQRLPGARRTVAQLVLRFLENAQAHREGDAVAMLTAASEASELLPLLSAEDAPGWARHRGATVASLGVAELWCGHPERAVRLLRDAVTTYPVSRVSGYSDTYYHGILGLAQVAMGMMSLGGATATAALDAARAQGRSRAYETQWAWLALGVSAHYRGDEAAARAASAACAEALATRANPFVAAQLKLLVAWRLFAAGNAGAARAQLAGLTAQLVGTPLENAADSTITALRIDLELAAGSVERARATLEEFDRRGPAGPDQDEPEAEPARYLDAVTNSRARVLLAEGRAEGVRGAVADLLEHQGVQGIRAWLAVAQAEERLRHDSLAMAALARALDLAAPQGVLLPFLRPPPALAAALRRHLEIAGTHRAFVEEALATASNRPADPPAPARTVEPLTERERSVLAYLPTISSNAEIAAALNISENTVKQHLKSTYRKLAVANRREAVRVAREHGLLPWPGQGVPISAGES